MVIFEQDKVLYEEASNGDKTIIMPVTRANNVEGLGRSANTKFVAGDVVYVDNNKKVALKCIVGGTTGTGELDVSSKAIGATVTDGSVTWQVCNRTSDVTSVNGQTGDVIVDTLPIGSILPFGGDAVPVGWLTCNGAAVSRTTYADLFAVIGTRYGSGNGSTTFNLPNSGSNLVSDVASGDVPVVGNGMTVGLTDGSTINYGLTGLSSGQVGTETATYGKPVGTARGGDSSKQVGIGITTDQSKSGIVAKMTATKTEATYIIKAFSTITNEGNIDVQNLASDYERINAELAKVNGISDYIIESYRSGTEWYDIYKSGKVRQGGAVSVDNSGTNKNFTVSLNVPFKNTDYFVIPIPVGGVAGTSTYQYAMRVMSKATSNFEICVYNDAAFTCSWEAEGQGA